MTRLANLFSPIKIGGMEVKNRLIMAPMGTNMAGPECGVSKAQIAYHDARARGGVGMIITEDTIITEDARYEFHSLGLFEDRLVPSWQELTKMAHGYGVKIGPQLIHPSFNARASLSGTQPMAASPIASRRYKEMPRELSVKEIKEIVGRFGDAARRARQAGCDFVQLHCAHCHHLLGSFLSPTHNKRADEYGGAIESRARLAIEVIRSILDKAGKDFPVLIRISGDEFEPGGLTLEHQRYVAQMFEEAGVSAIHISAGTGGLPTGVRQPMGGLVAPNARLSEVIKKAVNVPVISVGDIHLPWLAEAVLATGRADMVAMGRPLLADPDLPNKAALGKFEDIRPCMRDGACTVHIYADGKIACMVNPAVGNELDMDLKAMTSPRKVLVVGGGPGGMQVAQVAASRGHDVTLMERSPKLGGQLLMAAFPPTKQELAVLVKFMAGQLAKTSAKVELNTEATRATLEKLKPDVVVDATGGVFRMPKGMKGTRRKNVVTAWDVLSGRVMVRGQVLVIGGGEVGCETAEFIAHPVNDMSPGADRVTLLEYLDNVALDNLGPHRSLMVMRLQEKGVRIITSAECLQVLDGGVRYCKDGKEETLTGFNYVVLATGTSPNRALSGMLKDSGVPVHTIGDAREPRRAEQAIAEGWALGRSL